jgi:hypothetical protein
MSGEIAVLLQNGSESTLKCRIRVEAEPRVTTAPKPRASFFPFQIGWVRLHFIQSLIWDTPA